MKKIYDPNPGDNGKKSSIGGQGLYSLQERAGKQKKMDFSDHAHRRAWQCCQCAVISAPGTKTKQMSEVLLSFINKITKKTFFRECWFCKS
jgi:hypothetical protein